LRARGELLRKQGVQRSEPVFAVQVGTN